MYITIYIWQSWAHPQTTAAKRQNAIVECLFFCLFVLPKDWKVAKYCLCGMAILEQMFANRNKRKCCCKFVKARISRDTFASACVLDTFAVTVITIISLITFLYMLLIIFHWLPKLFNHMQFIVYTILKSLRNLLLLSIVRGS